MKGVGVGDSTATPLAATITWMLRGWHPCREGAGGMWVCVGGWVLCASVQSSRSSGHQTNISFKIKIKIIFLCFIILMEGRVGGGGGHH